MVDAAHKRWWQIFEVVFGLPVVVGAALQILYPLSIPFADVGPVAAVFGAALGLIGLVFVALARREFARSGQPTDPGKPTSRLVTTGVFTVSRNPLYLGGVLLLAGIGLAFNLIWVLLALLPGLIACYQILILPEERYLATKFPQDYPAYANKVRRWLGRSKS